MFWGVGSRQRVDNILSESISGQGVMHAASVSKICSEPKEQPFLQKAHSPVFRAIILQEIGDVYF